MKELNVISKPYDDDNLVFNESTGRYELTLQYLKNNFGSSYRNDGEAKRRIKLNSQVVYYYINLHTASFNRQVVNFLLNKTEQGRAFLLELLSAQQYADLQTGYNDLMFNPAVSFTGQDKDRNEIRRNSLCVAAEDIFNSSASYFGFPLGYQGVLPAIFYVWSRQ
jgi:hypothetical protein